MKKKKLINYQFLRIITIIDRPSIYLNRAELEAEEIKKQNQQMYI